MLGVHRLTLCGLAGGQPDRRRRCVNVLAQGGHVLRREVEITVADLAGLQSAGVLVPRRDDRRIGVHVAAARTHQIVDQMRCIPAAADLVDHRSLRSSVISSVSSLLLVRRT